MIAGMCLGAPRPAELDDLLDRAAREEVTYDHVGSTLHPERWPARNPHVERLVLGDGPATFAAAVHGLRNWACQPGIGALVHPATAHLVVGETLLVVLAIGPVRVIVPDRIVEVIDEPLRFGFAYGTLPGHHERGEEAFVVEQRSDGSVQATVRVDATTATVAAKLVGPLVLRFQHVAVRRYLAALAEFVNHDLE